ncbi:MAG: LysM peptidoglycan-binding domain-containing protein [Gemmatimonadaceae bacterium]|nr:LysM peptidoglycan-binding domain-containing protein [Gemmatimonadaceae bacterium]
MAPSPASRASAHATAAQWGAVAAPARVPVAPAPPEERRVRRGRRRLVVAVTSGSALLLVIAALTVATLFPPIGARRSARLQAEREVAAQLQPGERLIATAYASQREWTDVFREAFGILVATDRRLLYLSVPPIPLLRPREAGPTELRVGSWNYDASFTLEPHTFVFGLVRGVELRTPIETRRFFVAAGEEPTARRIARAAAEARRAVTDVFERELAAQQTAPPEVTTYITHIVRPGETLIALARKYGTTQAVLQQLNALPTGSIRVGQRLRVPQVPVDSTVRDSAAPPPP